MLSVGYTEVQINRDAASGPEQWPMWQLLAVFKFPWYIHVERAQNVALADDYGKV